MIGRATVCIHHAEIGHLRVWSAALMLWLSLGINAQVQESDTVRLSFFKPASAPHRARIIGINSGLGVTYVGMMAALHAAWYKQYPRTAFHFYNDNGEWNQMDKIGHAWTAYVEGRYGVGLYRWAGLPEKKAIWIGGFIGSLAQTSIEILDGFSAKWGASPGDLLANTLGSGLVISQELLWKEQKIKMKFSSHIVDYSGNDQAVQIRADELFGHSLLEKILKDYNGQSYWVSFCPWALRRPKVRMQWLNISLGYGIEDVLGGYRNTWLSEGQAYDYTHLGRQRTYMLSLDIDLEKIRVRRAWARTLLYALNIFKIPAPTLMINNNQKISFSAFYF